MTPVIGLPADADLRAVYPESERFARRMRVELHANRGKGDQAGWMAATPRELIEDTLYHLAKLSRAVRDEPWLVAELCADVANMAMMVGERVGVDWGAEP